MFNKLLGIFLLSLSIQASANQNIQKDAQCLAENIYFEARSEATAGWLGIELYGIFLPVVLAIIGVSSGSTAIGSEEDSCTLELLLASPGSRTRIVVEKSLSITIQIGLVAISVWVGVALGTFLFPFEVSLIDVLLATLMAWLYGISISYLSLCVHSITGRKGFAIGVGSLFVGFSYIVNILAQLLNSLSGLKYLSTFYS